MKNYSEGVISEQILYKLQLNNKPHWNNQEIRI